MSKKRFKWPTFEKFENWIKRHKYLSLILIFVFVIGIIMQIVDFFNKMSGLFDSESYPIIDIHLDEINVTSESIEEGIGMGNNVFMLEPIEEKKEELFTRIKSNPNEIYLIRIAGTTPIESLWIGGLAEQSSFSINIGTNYYDWDSLVMHFPKTETLTGWNSFNEGVAGVEENFVELVGFFRFVFVREKADNSNQYKLQPVEPSPETARKSIKILESSSEQNKFFVKNL